MLRERGICKVVKSEDINSTHMERKNKYIFLPKVTGNVNTKLLLKILTLILPNIDMNIERGTVKTAEKHY